MIIHLGQEKLSFPVLQNVFLKSKTNCTLFFFFNLEIKTHREQNKTHSPLRAWFDSLAPVRKQAELFGK